MLVLVIGLVAVIIAVLVTVFLVTRRREDDDEPGGRQTVRDRLRGRDARLSTDPRAARKPAGRGSALSARPAGEPRGYGGPGRGYESAGFDQSRGYEPSPRGYGEGPARSGDGLRTERMQPVRGGGRYQDAPEPATVVSAGHRALPRRPAGPAWPPIPARARALRHGPSAADFPATRVNADRTWRIQTSSRGCGRISRRRRPRPGRRTRARAAAGRPVDGTTTMTTTGRARSGTSSPTRITGPNCPPTTPSRPRPAPRTPAPPPGS